MAHPKDILNSIGASALKSLSQNFLTSPHWAEKLVTSVLTGPECDEYWEIGPGLGALSSLLIAQAKKPVRLFEIDRKISEYLTKEFPTTPLVQGDFLRYDWGALAPGKKVAVLSNLPYHLSSPLLFLMAEKKTVVTHFVFTFQKEFADRLTAAPGGKEYGALTLLMQLHFKMESLGVLPPGAFFPSPSIASEGIRFTPLNDNPRAQELTAIIKAAFSQRRKKMTSNLKKAFPEVDWNARFEKANLSLDARAETLSLADFEKL